MSTTAHNLLPTLADLFNKRRRHPITDLRSGDSLHLTAPIKGFPNGRRLFVAGFCTQYDTQGQPFGVMAYVRPDGLGEHVLRYEEREAGRYPSDGQREQWFGSVLMFLIQIDLTDYADCLKLERASERLVPLVPAAVEASPYRQAA